MSEIIHSMTMESLHAFDTIREQLTDELNDLRNKFKELSKDGWKVKEVLEFFIVSVGTLHEMIRAKEMTEEYKNYFILETIEDLYYEQDPEWPYVPEFIERMLEDLMFDHILPVVVEVVRKHADKVKPNE